MSPMSQDLLIGLLAIGPGLLQGLVGGGGALLYLSILVLTAGAEPKVSLGTALVAAAAGGIAAAAVSIRRGRVDWRAVGWILLGIPVPLALTPWVMSTLPDRWFAPALVGVYAVMLLAAHKPLGTPARMSVRRLMGLGLITGVTASGFGVAGGPLVARSLRPPSGSGQAAVVAVAVVVAAATNTLAGLAYLMAGRLLIENLMPLVCGAVIGAVVGSRLGWRADDKWLSLVVTVATVATMISLLFR